MKNNKTTISIVVICFTALLLSPLVAFKGEDKKPKTTIVTETKCFVHYSMNIIKTYIDTYSKQGYTVKLITSQNVSTSIDQYYHTYHDYKDYRDIKGDIILVLEKQTTVTSK
jgi:hypothetical protein